MRKQITRFMGTLGCMLLAACATAPGPFAGSSFAPDSETGPRQIGNATVIQGESLWRRSGDLLSVMRDRVSGMRIQAATGCPAVILRGQKSLVTPSNAQVYVNGQRANDTCILENMRASDVERVEVYPMGVTSRPGYASHPYGLILVFLRSAE